MAIEFDRSVLGVESEPIANDVEKGAVRRFVEAIGDNDPIYVDEEAAKRRGYERIPIPPTFLCTFRSGARPDIKLKFEGKVNLNGGNEYEYLKPIYVGDVISATTKVIDVYEKTGRTGTMVFTVSETTFRNQKGEIVAKGRNTGITRG